MPAWLTFFSGLVTGGLVLKVIDYLIAWKKERREQKSSKTAHEKDRPRFRIDISKVPTSHALVPAALVKILSLGSLPTCGMKLNRNNEEAGVHRTPREAAKLVANLIFLRSPTIQSGSYLLYDCVCCEGGMLTVAEERVKDLTKKYDRELVHSALRRGDQVWETCVVCMSEMLLKGPRDTLTRSSAAQNPPRYLVTPSASKSSTRCWPTAKSKETSKSWKQAQ